MLRGMTRRWLLVLVAVLSGCSGDSGRPIPDEPPTGALLDEIALEGTRFALYQEGDGCLAVEAIREGLQTTVFRRCAHGDPAVVDQTGACGWLEDSPSHGPGDYPCDVQLSTVWFGHIAEPVAYVCVARLGEPRPDGEPVVEGVRFLRPGADGIIFEPVQEGEGWAGFLFSASGSRFGDPPVDRPAEPIYRECERLAPWDG